MRLNAPKTLQHHHAQLLGIAHERAQPQCTHLSWSLFVDSTLCATFIIGSRAAISTKSLPSR
jgi:hypothetical protein